MDASGNLVAGYPEEVAAFGARNREFVKSLDPLGHAFNAVFTREWWVTSPADPIIYYLGRRCADDFLEIVLLCANGHGGGSSSLLRGLYERAVTAAYLHMNPEQVTDFLDYDYVRRHKLESAIESLPGDHGDYIDERRELESRFQEVRERFMIASCKKCGTQRLNHTWSQLDFVSMAGTVGDLGRLIVPAYYMPLSHAHSTVRSISARLEEDDGKVVERATPDYEDIDFTARVSHGVVLEALRTQIEHFSLESAENVLERAVEGYHQAWENSSGQSTA